MKTQQVDAEFVYEYSTVYAVSLERLQLAQRDGNFREASFHRQRAMEARAALPQFNLEGLWVGKYSDDGYEMINVTYQGDVLVAQKVTGTKNVPKGQATFRVDLSPPGLTSNEYFSFAWLPIGHQVFFGRPTPELILKLMKEEHIKQVGDDGSARAFLEKCWDETEHLQDDLDVQYSNDNNYNCNDQWHNRCYYDEPDCFQ